MARNKASVERERLMASLSGTLPRGEGDYELSAALTEPERKRFLGLWTVEEHTVDGRPFLESFARASLGGAALEDGRYEASYDFRGQVCVKRASVSGNIAMVTGPQAYEWRMGIALTWEPARGAIRVRPELGYQSASVGGAPAALRELDSGGGPHEIHCRFEGEDLVLEEGGDRKVLRRCPA